jgi:hypothetical protein
MIQLSLFDAIRSPAILLPVDGGGEVIQGEIDEVHVLPHRRLVWDVATIEIHQHTDGRWMWATGWMLDWQGSGYRVGPKWGHFAESRDDALHYAKEELRTAMERIGDVAHRRPVLAWLETLH